MYVLDIFHVTVVHVGAGVTRPEDVREVALDGHGDRPHGLAVEEGDHVAETMPVQRVGVDQVRAHLQAQVGQLQAESLGFIHPEERRRVLGSHLLIANLVDVQSRHVAEAEDISGKRCGRQIVGMVGRQRR